MLKEAQLKLYPVPCDPNNKQKYWPFKMKYFYPPTLCSPHTEYSNI